MSNKKRFIECAHHQVQVSFVTKLHLRRLITPKPKKNEVILGCYLRDENKIYICKGMDDHKTKHTLLHELKHAFDHQTEGMDEEGVCDAFATVVMRLCNQPWQEMLQDVIT